MDQKEQINQPEETPREPRQRTRAAQDGSAIRVDSIMSARRRIDQIEEMLSNSTRVPFKNQLSMVNVGELLNLTSELRTALPEAVKEAVEILRDKQQIELTSQQRAQERTAQADEQARTTVEQANAKAKQTLEAAQQRAIEIEQQARATAEKILMQANADAQLRIEESEIVRRANVRAKEIYDQVQMDVDGVYKTAYTEVNKMLSGATAALNRSALELAGLRDQLLNAGNGDQSAR